MRVFWPQFHFYISNYFIAVSHVGFDPDALVHFTTAPIHSETHTYMNSNGKNTAANEEQRNWKKRYGFMWKRTHSPFVCLRQKIIRIET